MNARLSRSLSRLFLCRLAAACLVGLLSLAARADGTVAGCTEDDLLNALFGGGDVTFDADCSITITAPITIDSDTTIDAQGHNVTISGGNLVMVFEIEPSVNFTAIGLTITGGVNTNGGALYINDSATVLLTNCTLIGNSAIASNGVAGANGTSGSKSSGGNGQPGTVGDAAFGGAVYNLGDLTLVNCNVTTNLATGGNGGNGGNGGDGAGGPYVGGNGAIGAPGGEASGGGIYNLGTLTLTNCTFFGNSVTGGNGGTGGGGGGNTSGNAGSGGNGAPGASAFGGGVLNLNTLSVMNCTFAGNKTIGGNGGVGGTNGAGPFTGVPGTGAAGGAGFGGGIYSTQALQVAACTFSTNIAVGGVSAAGGQLANGTGTTGPAGANSFGGGLYVSGDGAITNCTFFTNSVIGGTGGKGGDGVGNAGNGGNGGTATGGGLYGLGDVSVVNCTFSTCQAVGGTNGLAGSGAFPGSNGQQGAAHGGGIASGNGAVVLMNSLFSTNKPGNNIFGSLTDAGGNMSSDSSTMLTNSRSFRNKDPKLLPLADNGGPTLTCALRTNSPAIDDVNIVDFPPTDQRGIPRPAGKASDIGAFELILAPVIIVQPQSQTQTNGGSVTFTVDAAGDSLSYRWRFNSTNIANASRSSLTISSVSNTNEGNYTVVITNNFGSVTSAVATLTVPTPPLITVQPTNVTVNGGAPATLSVVATGDLPLIYQWQLNGTNVTSATNANYTVASAQNSNSGPYQVIITNISGSVTSAVATLTVNAGPTIVTQPVSQTASVGGSVTFSVTASGPSLTYQWLFYGTNISGATAPTFTRSSVQTNHAGPYNCVVANSYGSTESATANLNVVLPVINGRVLFGTNGLSGVSVSIGTNVSLVTDPTGSFATALNPGTYVVTPSLTNYAFAPGSILVTIPPDATGLNFTGVVAYAISGQVVDQSSNGLAGVTVMADTNSAVTGPNGNYTIPSVRPGTYFVSASGSNQVFTPSSQQVDVSNFVSGINFALAYQVSFISGRVTQNGAGLPNVKIVTGGSGSTTTDFDGNYALTVKDGTYIVTPQLSGVAFSPSSSVVTVPPAAVGIDFVAGTVITFITNTPSGTVQITVIGPRGQVNWVEASTNLVDWIVISTNTTPFTFTDSKAVNFTSRFYRTLVK